MHRVTVKTSTIFIAKGNRTRVYRSVSEIPQRLRKELEESTNSFNSATILIADRRGREEILRAAGPTLGAAHAAGGIHGSHPQRLAGAQSRAASGSLPAAKLAGTAASRRSRIAAVGSAELAVE